MAFKVRTSKQPLLAIRLAEKTGVFTCDKSRDVFVYWRHSDVTPGCEKHTSLQMCYPQMEHVPVY